MENNLKKKELLVKVSKIGTIITGALCVAVPALVFWLDYRSNSEPIEATVQQLRRDLDGDGRLENLVGINNPDGSYEELLLVDCGGRAELVRYTVDNGKIKYSDQNCRN